MHQKKVLNEIYSFTLSQNSLDNCYFTLNDRCIVSLYKTHPSYLNLFSVPRPLFLSIKEV